jgi:hypothetical protein
MRIVLLCISFDAAMKKGASALFIFKRGKSRRECVDRVPR